MDENSKKVLDMLAEGKITADEAARLLEKLGRVRPAEAPAADSTAGDLDAAVPAAERQAPKNPRYLRVVVQSANKDNVNVRVPMALVRTGIRLGALMPEQARKELEGKGVDLSALSKLDGDELVQALAELTVDVESGNGDKVRVFCE
jgi:hypothetical protein